MLITPTRGKRVFAILMIVIGLAIISGLMKRVYKSRFRTSTVEANILDHYNTGAGIGSLRQYSINTRYEFFVDGLRFENQQEVDSLRRDA